MRLYPESHYNGVRITVTWTADEQATITRLLDEGRKVEAQKYIVDRLGEARLGHTGKTTKKGGD